MISLKLSMKCSCCTNSGKKGATKTLSPHMSLYQFLFNLTEPCKTRSQSHKLNELIFSQVQLGCSLLDVGTKATPSAHLAIRSLPFGLPQMIKLVGIALAKLNSNQTLKHMFSSEFSHTDKTKDCKNQGTSLGVACWGYGEHSLSQAWWIAGCWTSAWSHLSCQGGWPSPAIWKTSPRKGHRQLQGYQREPQKQCNCKHQTKLHHSELNQMSLPLIQEPDIRKHHHWFSIQKTYSKQTCVQTKWLLLAPPLGHWYSQSGNPKRTLSLQCSQKKPHQKLNPLIID